MGIQEVTRAIPLPEAHTDGVAPLERALRERRSTRAFNPEALGLSSLAQLLWAAQGVSDPQGLRTAPSAGALYPLEIYAVAGRVVDLRPGIYRYRCGSHDLVPMRAGDLRRELASSALGQDWMVDAPFTMVIAGDVRRTARKYGERAARYMYMEVGAVAQNIYLQASALELGTVFVGAFNDRRVKEVLGLPGEEQPLALMPVGRPRN